MNTTLEDRLRHHYSSVADELVLDEVAFADVLERGVDADVTRLGPDGHQRSHRVGGWIAAAAVLALVVGGLVVLGGRGPDELPTSSAPPTMDATAEGGLLLPVGLDQGETPEVNIVEADNWSAAGLVVSPNGTPYRISARPNTTPVNPGSGQRDIGAHQVDVVSDGVFNNYTIHDDCVVVGITEPSEASVGSSVAIGELLEGVTIADSAVNVILADGWQSFGAGHPGRLLQVTYDYRFGDGVHTVTLAQAVDTPIAALQGITLAPLEPALLDGQHAWTFEWPQTDLRSLIWNDNGNAVMLTTDLPLDELTRHAAVDLQHGQTFGWDGALDIAPEATAPEPAPASGTCPVSATLAID